MNREIRFRARRVDNNEWVYGGYYCKFSRHTIITDGYNEYSIQVVPESVCQFTGLKDKNGTEIYEGDQLAPDTDNEEVKSVVRWDETFAKFVVDIYGYNYHIGEGSQEVYDNKLSICDTYDLGDMILEYCQVIGNIHPTNEGKEVSC